MSERFHLALLHGAAFLVRAPERKEWLAEWRAELWYVRPRRRTAFCLGAFRDAIWMRRHGPPPVYLQSPWQCLSVLTVLAALSAFFAFEIPLPHEMLFSHPFPAGLATITGISVDNYHWLSGGKSSFAFYGPARRDGELTVALASRNLLDLLRLPVGTIDDPRVAPLIVAGHDPSLLGRRLTVAGQQVQVAAILPDRVWPLPGRADAWLLVDDLTLAAEPPGYVVAQMNPSSGHVSVHHPDGSVDRFICVPLTEPNLLVALILMMAAGAIVLPAVTSLSFGEYPAHHFRRWIFLAAKLALVLPIILFGSLDVLSVIAIQVQPHALIVGSVLGFRCVLMDQRRRCPVCLRVLTHPMSVGAPSRTLLEWYGTELICARGHGLLHVPEIRNSYSEQRWLHLDSSWSSLFS